MKVRIAIDRRRAILTGRSLYGPVVIREIYGATEGNVSMLNYDGKENALTTLIPDPNIVMRFHRSAIRID